MAEPVANDAQTEPTVSRASVLAPSPGYAVVNPKVILTNVIIYSIFLLPLILVYGFQIMEYRWVQDEHERNLELIEGRTNERLSPVFRKIGDGKQLTHEEEAQYAKYWDRRLSHFAEKVRTMHAIMLFVFSVAAIFLSFVYPNRIGRYSLEQKNRFKAIVLSVWTIGVPTLMYFEWTMYYVDGIAQLESFKYSLELQTKIWLAVTGVLSYSYFKKTPDEVVASQFGDSVMKPL